VFQDVTREKDSPNKVQLDSKREPMGKYVDLFRANIVAFSKELDPGPNWEARNKLHRIVWKREFGMSGSSLGMQEGYQRSN
jgi:hypothetical protein